MDSTFDAWSMEATRGQLAWEITACSALLKGAKALREAQMSAAEQAEAAHLQAAQQLLDARSLDEFAGIQFELLRSDTEGAMQYWMRLSEVMVQNMAEAWQEAGAGWTKASESLWQGFNAWSKLQTAVPQTADIVEAEVEHVANPMAASPFVWPAQEAARQAMTLAGQGWNDWLGWSRRLGSLGGAAAS